MEFATKVHIKTTNQDMASVISQNNRENIYSFLRRLDFPIEQHWEKEVYAMVLKDAVLANPEYILCVYQRQVIEFLLQLWESDSIEVSQYDWAMIGQLKLMGLVDYSYNESQGKPFHEIYIIQEAREAFYFYLKSRTSRRIMERYESWELLVRGMMAYYGIISFQRLYYLFCRITKSPIDDTEFHRFLSARITMFQFGGFALEKSSNIEYYQNFEVTNPEQILEKRQKESKLEYNIPDYDNSVFIAENNGIGEWDGVSKLAEILLQKLEIEYYRTVVIVKSCILMAQNDETLDNIKIHLYGSCPEARGLEAEVDPAVYAIYQNVPVFHLKGWNRNEFKKKQRKNLSFTVIKGGKEN